MYTYEEVNVYHRPPCVNVAAILNTTAARPKWELDALANNYDRWPTHGSKGDTEV